MPFEVTAIVFCNVFLWQAAAAEKLKRLMELLAIIRAKPKEPEPEPEPEEEDDSLLPGLETKPKKKPTTLFLPSAEDMEHRALQAAVLQEWESFRALSVH